MARCVCQEASQTKDGVLTRSRYSYMNPLRQTWRTLTNMQSTWGEATYCMLDVEVRVKARVIPQSKQSLELAVTSYYKMLHLQFQVVVSVSRSVGSVH